MISQNHIRNVALIAHINHGKSTLADRLLEKTGTIPPLKMRAQVLDNMELERERGVTIKLKAVRMRLNGLVINLIDTPGHVDFSYEVSRSLAACEGALLIVDAVAGIQAQTVAHTKKALDLGLKIIPVVNKTDLSGAEPERVADDLVQTFGFSRGEILFASAKKNEGTEEILRAIVERVPSPRGEPSKPLRALVFDSSYDEYKGAIAFVRIVDGGISQNEPRPWSVLTNLHFLASGAECEPVEVGYFTPEMKVAEGLGTGEVGYIATGLKDISLVRVGDTVTKSKIKNQKSNIYCNVSPLLGYKEPKPVVFVSFYPLDNKDFSELETALKKLRLTDPAVSFSRESGSLGQGFRCGFLGVFHAEIVKERLERDYNLELFATSPSVEYLLTINRFEESPTRSDNQQLAIKKPSDLPQTSMEVLEPWVRASIFSPKDYLGSVIQLCQDKRGIQVSTDYVGESQVKLVYELPLSELISDFFDQLKSLSSGFASLDYELIEHRPVEVSRLDILIAGDLVEPLAQIVLKERAAAAGRQVVERLKKVVPKQQFAISLQAVVGGKILARETIPALRKDVTAKLYGGDVTRKRKLLEKQKKGKKKLKKFGRVPLPQEAFFATKSNPSG